MGEEWKGREVMDLKTLSRSVLDRGKEVALRHRRYWPAAVGVVVLLLIYGFSRSNDTKVVYEVNRQGEFKEGRILGSPLSTVVDGKERMFAKHAQELQTNQTHLQESIELLTKKVNEMSEKMGGVATKSEANPSPTGETAPTDSIPPVQFSEGNPQLHAGPVQVGGGSETRVFEQSRRTRSVVSKGPTIISFPVKEEEIEQKKPGVVLPPGSYVKGKILTGVEAPEGKTYPVLVQLDFAYIMPNHNRLDLSGCFMIAKATGNLSIERVEMQVTKLSCVSKTGAMFERDVSGFIADDKDNSFAVLGSVNSKQDRVAAMAFLASIVEGVSKAVQQAQTTQQTNAVGGSQSLLTGDQMKYIGAGGASEAASTVANWYLHQAQNLLPTINVGSGRDVWVVMQESVSMPENYFKKGEDSNAVYTHFTRMLN